MRCMVGALCMMVFMKKASCASSAGARGKDNGFGSHYIWAGSLESGLQIANNHRKPAMLIIHKSSCPACLRLKSKFASSTDIQNLSGHFVFINLMDDEEPPEDKYAPDGDYIPRILFISPTGYIDTDIYNEAGNNTFKYFYSKPEQIATSMKKVLDKYNKK